MNSTSLPLLLVAALLATGVQTPVPAGPPGSSLIVGQIIDHAGKPVSGAIVALSGGPPAQAGAPGPSSAQPPRVLTDQNGGFVFFSLRAGSYTLAATRAGYIDGAYGRLRPGGSSMPLTLGDRQNLGPISIRMWKAVALAGRVIDEAGEPAVYVSVRALRRTMVAGRRRFTNTGTAVTDDRGAFRISNLVPGDYVVVLPSTQTTLPLSVAEAYWKDTDRADLRTAIFSATGVITPPGDPQNQVIGDAVLQSVGQAVQQPAAAADGRLAVYPTTFHPSATSAQPATVISLGPGEDRTGVDIQLKALPSFTVSGVLASPSGPATLMAVQLLVPRFAEELDAEKGVDAATSLTDGAGRFKFLGVTPGQYTFRALKVPPPGPRAPGVPGPPPVPAEPVLWAAEQFTVADRDVTLAVALSPGSRVTGRFEFEGSLERPTADRLRTIPIVIEAADGRILNSVPPGQGDAAGTFTTYGVPPGRYLVRVGGAPTGWTFKTAMFEGKDVSESYLELKAADAAGIVVTFTDKPSQLSGSVRTSQASPDIDATVVVVPTDPAAWVDFGVNPRRIRSARVNASGAYSFTGLPAAEYFVVAIPEASAGSWLDPALLQTLTRTAPRVRLGDGERRVQDLTTVVIR